MSRIKVRKGMPDVQLTRKEFESRFRDRFFDPAFAKNEAAIRAIIETAWDGYDAYRKNPVKRVAGEGYAKPNAELPVEWLATKAAIDAAEERQKNPKSPSRILLVHALGPELPRRNVKNLAAAETCGGSCQRNHRI